MTVKSLSEAEWGSHLDQDAIKETEWAVAFTFRETLSPLNMSREPKKLKMKKKTKNSKE